MPGSPATFPSVGWVLQVVAEQRVRGTNRGTIKIEFISELLGIFGVAI
jgi:hypothetical protein